MFGNLVVSVCLCAELRSSLAPRRCDDTTFEVHRSLSSISLDLARSLPLSLRADATLDCRVSRLARSSSPSSLRPSVRSSARPSVRPSLSPSASVIRRSTLAVAVATVARSSRIVAARPTPPPVAARPPPLPPALPRCRGRKKEGRRGRARWPISPSECPQADFAIGEQRDRGRGGERQMFTKEGAPRSLHLIIWPNDLFPAEGGKEGRATLQTQKC